jgi:TonB family protein
MLMRAELQVFDAKGSPLHGDYSLDWVSPYPPSARANYEQGRVVLYAVQEADGALSHLTIIHRAAPDLEAAAVEAVRRWHYRPAVCGQTPIRMEIQSQRTSGYGTSVNMKHFIETVYPGPASNSR